MAENTIQFEWITTIKGNLDALFGTRDDVFVAGDNFWYPVEGNPKICAAPDVYVVFGRPKGHRGNYKQWEEANIPLSVVFEIQTPGNRFRELLDKFEFYQEHGVQEYYLIDPDPDCEVLEVWERARARLRPRDPSNGWVSPLLGVQFHTTPTTVRLHHPDGKPFLTFEELSQLQTQTLLDLEIQKQLAEKEKQRADKEKGRADALAARLREMGIDPNAV